jgi:hypothetical protein
VGLHHKGAWAATLGLLLLLLLLPHGWQAAVQPSPRKWLGSYVTAVLRVR